MVDWNKFLIFVVSKLKDIKMDNAVTLNCEAKTLQVNFKNESFSIDLFESFNLTKYVDNGIRTPEHNWHIIKTNDDRIWGLQFIWIKELDGIMPRKPRIKIYQMIEQADGTFNTDNMHRLPITKKIGHHYDYFYLNENFWDVCEGIKIEAMKELKM